MTRNYEKVLVPNEGGGVTIITEEQRIEIDQMLTRFAMYSFLIRFAD